jgi:sarcosine oxidase
VTVYDAIVIGLGGAGSAAAYHLARSRAKILGLERFGPTHAYGSSHGKSRIYRTAYSEGVAYVPLTQRAQVLWRQLQERSGERIIQPTGGLLIGDRESRTVAGALLSATACSLDHDLLSAREVADRYPQFSLRPSEVAVYDPNAGVLFPEACIHTHSSGAVEAGAELHYGEPATKWSASADGVEVETRSGTYRTRSLVLTVGAWTRELASDLSLPLEIERQFMLWFPASEPEVVRPSRMPVFLWDRGDEARTYGVPDFGQGVKIGSWPGKVAASPESADRVFRERDALAVRKFVAASLRGLEPQEREWMSCLYTNAPDHNFLLGRHPRHPNVLIVSACSGHGFKFTSVVGEVISRLVRQEPPGFDLSLFDPGRFLPTPPSSA